LKSDYRTAFFIASTIRCVSTGIGVSAVKIRYYLNTDTLYIEFHPIPVAETKDLDEDTQVDLDKAGNICAITVEHASRRADLPALDYEQVAA
jgi:uncharacterized protein YuzE